MLYTGRKIDTWFSINTITGAKEQLLSFNEAKNICPLETQNTIFVGRTEYNIIMVDSKHKDRKWNVTFYDYSAAKMGPDLIDDYGMSIIPNNNGFKGISITICYIRIIKYIEIYVF